MLKRSLVIDRGVYNFDIIDSLIGEYKDSFSISFKNGELEIGGNTEEEVNEITGEFLNLVLATQIENDN